MNKSIQSWLRVFIALPVLALGFTPTQAATTCQSMPCCAASCASHCSPNKKSTPCHLKKTAPHASALDAKASFTPNRILAVGFAPSSILFKPLSRRTPRLDHSCQSPPFRAAPSGLSPPLA